MLQKSYEIHLNQRTLNFEKCVRHLNKYGGSTSDRKKLWRTYLVVLENYVAIFSIHSDFHMHHVYVCGYGRNSRAVATQGLS